MLRSANCLSVYPPLSPRVLLRRPVRRLPFPLDQPDCRLYMQARQGLWWGLKGLGLGSGDEILAPAYHHGSEIEVLERTGARCRFYDFRETFTPDAGELEAMLGPRVRALYLIHPLGFAQDSRRWRRWCDENGLLLIEDGAQAWLSARGGRPVGADADLALFCLYKVFGVPDGGAVISRSFAGRSPEKYESGGRALVGRLADWGAQRSRLAASLYSRRRQQLLDEAPQIHFALFAVDERATRATRSLLSRVVDPDAPARRRANFARLAERIGGLLSPAFAEMPLESSPLGFPIEVTDKRAVLASLAKSGIVGGRMWTVPHPALEDRAFPGASALRARLVCLPVHQELGPRHIDSIAEAVTAALQA